MPLTPKAKPAIYDDRAGNSCRQLGAQMNFSSTLVKDNSLTGDASYGEPHVRIKSINNITFSFM
ncbi:hypothetical protein [Mucilaginibacter gilvus]|uniref:Uncharacterized protein n=1 Tax=Mucilaginibacter gilvus TaxID=2305909 RepID=A0A3S3VDP8_9SPHI|nr:hypothetical protein [Mucilaginibacter gilvus]RWY51203.1 hypothetical protein EPL05_14150 [Mucilaginibacter gilvus]